MELYDQLRQQIDRRATSGRWELVTVEFTAADTDTYVRHGLKTPTPEEIRYEMTRSNAATSLYNDTSASRQPWTESGIWLRASAPAIVEVRLSVPMRTAV